MGRRIAVLCGRDARLKVWTYDREFRTTWRKPDGRAIPMAVRVGSGDADCRDGHAFAIATADNLHRGKAGGRGWNRTI
ncbi:MAG: hypothetical protein ACRD3C_04320, partial [Vicinamibacterales bacterium]